MMKNYDILYIYFMLGKRVVAPDLSLNLEDKVQVNPSAMLKSYI